jgi:hypothetical protein
MNISSCGLIIGMIVLHELLLFLNNTICLVFSSVCMYLFALFLFACDYFIIGLWAVEQARK